MNWPRVVILGSLPAGHVLIAQLSHTFGQVLTTVTIFFREMSLSVGDIEKNSLQPNYAYLIDLE